MNVRQLVEKVFVRTATSTAPVSILRDHLGAFAIKATLETDRIVQVGNEFSFYLLDLLCFTRN